MELSTHKLIVSSLFYRLISRIFWRFYTKDFKPSLYNAKLGQSARGLSRWTARQKRGKRHGTGWALSDVEIRSRRPFFCFEERLLTTELIGINAIHVHS